MTRANFSLGCAAETRRGLFGRDEFGKLFFEFLQLLEEIIFPVGDDLPALNVISAVVPADFVGKLRMALLGGGVRHAGIVSMNRPAKTDFL